MDKCFSKKKFFLSLENQKNTSTFLIMSLAPPQAYTKETVNQALAWLNEQQPEWSLYIKDIDIAVRLYLKSRSKDALQSKKNIFTEELKKICMDSCEFPEEKANSLEEVNTKNLLENTLPPAKATPQTLISKESLDLKSQDFIQKAKDQLNLTQDDEVLRLLIRIGYHSLESFLK